MTVTPIASVRLDELRVRLATKHGAQLWRSLEELGEGKAFGDYLTQQFPRYAEQYAYDRREFLKLMAASLALGGLGACSREPQEKILPYVNAPSGSIAGEPRFFATATTQGGFATGVLVESNMGRPTKVEGNALHPASLGSTDVFAQASVLDLWDPDRSQSVTHKGQASTWEDFSAMLQRRLIGLSKNQGEGLRVLTETVTSPTLAAQLKTLLARYPKARWHQYEPINRDNVYEGTRLAFSEAFDVRYRFDKAKAILSLDADFLGAGNARVRYARDFAQGRGAGGQASDARVANRLYAIAGSPSLTSAIADHALALRAGDIENAARRIAKQLGVAVDAPTELAGTNDPWLVACARDLQANRDASLVIAGEAQPPSVHALAHAINHALGNIGATIAYTAPVISDPSNQTESLRALSQDMAAGAVDTLIVIGGNPAWCAPADMRFGESLSKVPLTARLGLHDDETSAHCQWHLPATHFLETWSDARAFDGTVTIMQPLIAPLYAGKSAHELLALLSGETRSTSHDIVRGHWRDKLGVDFEHGWSSALHEGVVAHSALPEKNVAIKGGAIARRPDVAGHADDASLELIFTPDPSTWDGSFANNAWLQELPRPLTKLTWDNAVLIAPALAKRLSLANEDVVELRHLGRTLEGPVWIVPGHADGTVSVSLGCGRTHAGRVGNAHGLNAYALRTSEAPWFASGVEIKKTGKTYRLATTQHHHAMEGRDLVRTITVAAFEMDELAATSRQRATIPDDTLYPEVKYDGYAWGMAINLGTCIGCNACTIACQAENNIPVVGKTEVARGREMHWIRVDRYYEGEPQAPKTHFQPVPCMQCERAPCEVVCPTEASVHDSEGLNVQVYNRCVGTRFCSNNCPYKVRRFNFFQYADEDTESLKAQRNPEVTVRMRGVMEKCSYCIQRIANGRIEADKDGRRIRDGEVVTACQAACPTQAITFGDLNDPSSRVKALKRSPLNYALLGELNTKPRTTYLAKLTNPNPDVAADVAKS
ncbi:MAG: TAT-variant-translocated molybdopterin oxidoreductase [Burkholderiaceae bacterium]